LKQIGILELHYHVKYLYTKAKICKTKETNITIFTTKEIYEKLTTYLKNTSEYDFVLKEKDESINSFLKKVKKICDEKIDLLFINTVQKSILDLPHYIRLNPNCKMVLTIHTANAWFSTKPALDIKQIFRTVDTNLSSIIAKMFILPKFHAINVIYAPIKQFILEKGNYKKNVFTLPFGFFEGNIDPKPREKDDKILFVIPGQIEEHRREYDIVLDAFEKLYKKFNGKIVLYLLGYPVGSYGKRILKRCKKLEKNGYNLKYFDSYVPEKLYDETMKSIDIIILPIKIKSGSFGVIPEFYGTTKGSAAVFEGIQYGKPLVVPKKFNMMEELESSTLKYNDSKDLENVLTELIENRERLEKLKKEAYKNSKYFSLDPLQKYFTDEILNNIDNL